MGDYSFMSGTLSYIPADLAYNLSLGYGSMYLPANTALKVKPGDKVKAKIDIIAEI